MNGAAGLFVGAKVVGVGGCIDKPSIWRLWMQWCMCCWRRMGIHLWLEHAPARVVSINRWMHRKRGISTCCPIIAGNLLSG
jgi:hypothetical protein